MFILYSNLWRFIIVSIIINNHIGKYHNYRAIIQYCMAGALENVKNLLLCLPATNLG